jgi:hypothetical protein
MNFMIALVEVISYFWNSFFIPYAMDFRDNPNVEGIRDFLTINANFEVFEGVLENFGMVYMTIFKIIFTLLPR